VAQVPGNKGQAAFFNAQAHGMAAHLETEAWAPSGQPRKAVEFVGARDRLGPPPPQQPYGSGGSYGGGGSYGDELPAWHFAAAAPPPPQLASPGGLPGGREPAAQSQRRHEPSPRKAAPWGTNYEASNAAAAAAQPLPPRPQHYPALAAPFDVSDGLPAPANIHFHTLDTTHAHPSAAHAPRRAAAELRAQPSLGPTLGFASTAGPKVTSSLDEPQARV
jgi:hypothetical protein